jgi:hypothetical protein
LCLGVITTAVNIGHVFFKKKEKKEKELKKMVCFLNPRKRGPLYLISEFHGDKKKKKKMSCFWPNFHEEKGKAGRQKRYI